MQAATGLFELDDAALDGGGGGLGAVLHAELFEDVADVLFDGDFGQAEFGGDFLVAVALDDEFEHALLAIGQGGSGEALGHAAGQQGGQVFLAAGELENTIVVMCGDNGMPFPRCKATLYDLRTDPGQLTNVVNRPEFASVRARLSRRLTDELRAGGDPKFALPEHASFRARGWPIHLHDRLWAESPAKTRQMLRLLDGQLKCVADVVPASALAALRQTPIWINPPYPGVRPRAEYHYEEQWLRANHRNPDMARAVEITVRMNFDPLRGLASRRSIDNRGLKPAAELCTVAPRRKAPGGSSLVKISRTRPPGESISACQPIVAPDPSDADSVQP